jgi:uncharacterized membrane protein YfcA
METELVLPIVALAFVCELVDSSLGMGYGTTLTPLLLPLGYEPLDVVPAVLFSEFITGLLAGVFFHEFGNVDLKPGTRDFKTAALPAILSMAGVLLAVGIAERLPAWVVKFYIGVLVLVIGLVIPKNSQREVRFSWRRKGAPVFLAAFNKGISGGGYGPVVTGGQVLASAAGAPSASPPLQKGLRASWEWLSIMPVGHLSPGTWPRR